MLRRLMKAWPYLVSTILLTFTLGMVEGYMMIRLMNLFDLALNKQMENFKTYGLEILGYAALLVPLAIVVTISKNLYKKKANEQIKNYYIEGIYNKNISEFQAENNAKYLSSLTNDFSTIEMKLIDPLYRMIDFGTVVIAGLWMVGTANPWFVLIGIGLAVVNTTISLLTSKPITTQTTLRSDLFEQYTGYIKEVLSLMVMFVMGIAGCFALTGRGTVGGVLLVIEGMYRVLEPLNMISEDMPGLLSVKGLIEKIEKTLQNTIQYEEGLEDGTLTQTIRFEDVSFGYDEKDKILEHVDVTFKKGGKYLVIGPSGGGKSTLLKLLRKYFNPTGATIWVDDKLLTDIKKEVYFKQITNVEQKVFLFEDTLRNNLTLYKDYTDEMIWDAIYKARLGDFVNAHPEGLDYMIYEDGKNISGGEKSRMAIARGLLEKADLILLDEAFSALDYNKAREIEESLLNLEGVTVIHVSHVLFKEHKEYYDGIYVVKNRDVYPYRKTVDMVS